jgi:hypothetical protein
MSRTKIAVARHGSRCHDLGKSLGHRAAIMRPSDVRLGTFNGFLMVQPGSKRGVGLKLWLAC